MKSEIDPITMEVIQRSLVAITDEMFAVTRKTAMSSVIYEVLDFGVAITDAQGALASAGAGIPSFVGMLDPAVKAILNKYVVADIRDGDVFISNDPYVGGVSHTNDVVVTMPVFFDGELVAWTANKGHWMDVGGMRPGSTTPDATELFQEGLILPEIRVICGGEQLQPVLDIISANSRLPKQAIGDLWAGIASLRMGAARIQNLCVRYGRDHFLLAVEDYLNVAEMRVRRFMKSIPHGTFGAEDSLDDGRELKVSVSITPDEFIVDLRGNPGQDDGPLNATYQATVVSVQSMFKSIVAPVGPANAGTFRPLRVLTDPGSLFDAKRPAAVGLYYENKIRSSDLVWKALAPYISAARSAGHFCSVCATLIGQKCPDGTSRSFIEPEVGGWGALSDGDGQSAQFSSSHGNTFNCPVEINEARNGIHVDELSLNSERSGAGEFRGGKGVDLKYQISESHGWVTAAYTRSKVKPWGLDGGTQGSLNKLQIIKKNGKTERLYKADSVKISNDDTVWITTANGAGYGDPRKRQKHKILNDLKNGYIDSDEAVSIYGLNEDSIAGR